jgi:hypothetical protein
MKGAEEVNRKMLLLGFIGRNDWTTGGVESGKDWIEEIKGIRRRAIDWNESERLSLVVWFHG